MNAFTRLRAVRAVLIGGIVVRAVAWGSVAGATLLMGAALVDLVAPLSLNVRNGLLGIAFATAIVVALAHAWRDRAVLSLGRVAIWVEERFPALEYRLVTAVESDQETLLAGVSSDSWTGTAGRRAMRALRAPIALIAGVLLVILALPAGVVARMRSPHAGDSIERDGRPVSASHLAPLAAQIVPPAYTGERAVAIDEPAEVRALAGSALTLRGRGDGVGIVARAGAESVAVNARRDRWEMTMRVPERPLAIRLSEGRHGRVIAIEPISDNPPAVALLSPLRDSVLRAPKGRIALSADATDDFGIAAASFEYIISSGEGETFTFRSGTLGAVKPSSRRVSLRASLSIDSLALTPGDIVHIRAVARDANDVSGPGIGTSETRVIRVARAGEYDSLAVTPTGAPDVDKGAISERMLIMLAEALEKRRPALERDVLVRESRAIAVDQRALRRSVGEIVFTRLGGESNGEEHNTDDSPARAKTMEEMLRRADSATNLSNDPIDFEAGESPVVAVNKPLLEAYNAMWDATTALELAEPARALPHMRRALAAIQRARQAERVYLRGTAPQIVIDIDKARLKGKDAGTSSTRRGIPAADSASRNRSARFMRAVELLTHDPNAVIDSLLIMRIDALTDNPAFAAAVNDAVMAMRGGKGQDATTALARARRALAGSPFAQDSLARWGIIP